MIKTIAKNILERHMYLTVVAALAAFGVMVLTGCSDDPKESAAYQMPAELSAKGCKLYSSGSLGVIYFVHCPGAQTTTANTTGKNPKRVVVVQDNEVTEVQPVEDVAKTIVYKGKVYHLQEEKQ